MFGIAQICMCCCCGVPPGTAYPRLAARCCQPQAHERQGASDKPRRFFIAQPPLQQEQP